LDKQFRASEEGFVSKQNLLKQAAIIGVALIISPEADAQTQCNEAPAALQQYVGQVNQVANFWYFQGIPQRCFRNPMCASAMLQQLNFWYQQQANLVNQWYSQIAVQCTNSRPTKDDMPFRDAKPGKDVDSSAIDDLDVDANDDKTVAIVIPDTPSGFRPKN
jgi:hypothetical protein